MILDQRVLHDLTDVSVIVNDFRNSTYPFPYGAGEYLYVGSILPINNLWIELGTVNAIAATVTPQIWWGGSDGWSDAVDVLDETVGLTKTGRLQWNTNIDKGWQFEYRSQDVPGLETKSIYNMYWLRFSWDLSLSLLTTIKYIGQKFSDDGILKSFYPDLLLPRMMAAFQTGKTSWDEQHYMAAEHICRDLKKRDIIKTRSQILDYGLFIDASCHKVAEIAYLAYGLPYFEHVKAARAAYNEAINLKFFNVDKNADGRLDPPERNLKTDFLTR